ncbi:MAG: phosphatase PAP2 family protein [Isosphaeraceae bacterium]
MSVRERALSFVGLYAAESVIAALAACGFGLLASQVAEGWLHGKNVQILRAIDALRCPPLDRLAVALSWLGGPEGITVLGVVATIGLLLRRRRIETFLLVAALLGGTALSVTLKPYFQRPRPDLLEALVAETGYGFPSSHALMSFCLYATLACIVLMGATRKAWRWIAAAALVLLASAIAWSRLYLGVHWLTDVLGGALVAAFWIAVSLGTLRGLGLLPAQDHPADEREPGTG